MSETTNDNSSNTAVSPLDDPSIKDINNDGLSTCPPLRWGLIGCGRVCHDFCQALKLIPSATVVACATRNDQQRAQAFADKHDNVTRAYGSYQELVNDESVQIVYVGNVHAYRRPIGEMCLMANKHVLMEKPFACTVKDAQYLLDLAKERNLFCLEGMWTRFFPAIEKARQVALDGDTFGEVVSVGSDFNFNASDSEEYPTSFFYNQKMGGGATYLVGPYPIAAVTMFYPNKSNDGNSTADNNNNNTTTTVRSPDKVHIVGQIDEATGVDLQVAMILSYPPVPDASKVDTKTIKLPGAGTACITYGILGESAEETVVLGTKARIVIESPGHCPTSIRVHVKQMGSRGASANVQHYKYALPTDTDAITQAGGYNYPNSAGFCYEAAAVARCIAAGKLEAPQYTWAETMQTTELLEQVRNELGTKPAGQEL